MNPKIIFQVEQRIVMSILSQRSLIIHESFSQDFVSTTEFWVRKDSFELQRKAERDLGKKVKGESGVEEEGEEDAVGKIKHEILASSAPETVSSLEILTD